jgi:ComEC/Rec2-like protein
VAARLGLFESRGEIGVFVAICLVVFVINVAIKFYEFSQFSSQKYEILTAKVLQDYNKTNDKNQTYRVLKFQMPDFSFYTTSRDFELDFQVGQFVKISVIKNRLKFSDFLSGNFYLSNIGILPLRYYFDENFIDVFRNALQEQIVSQHQSLKMRELFSALFLATSISKQLRADVNFYGIAHLIAISGYHIGLIFGFLYFVIRMIYAPFHQRFPYRNAKFDISVMIFTILIFYFILLGFVPSFLRALLMSLVAFYLFSRNVKILSFELLFVVICVAIAFFPSLIFSVGFYFSSCGVFYIYLYLHHFSRVFDGRFYRLFHGLALNFWVFCAMILPVLYFFPLISFQQFAVLPLTFLFVIFYPLSLVLHLFGLGGIFDEYLLEFLSWRLYGVDLNIPTWLFVIYNILSLISVKSKILATIIVGINLLCFCALL